MRTSRRSRAFESAFVEGFDRALELDHQRLALAVHGLAGGSGASTFATNLAWELASVTKEAPRVCLIDFDFQFGSAATYLDLPRKEAVFDLLSDAATADSDTLLQAIEKALG